MQHYNDKLQAVTTLTLKVTSWQCVCIRASDRKLCENTEVILQQRRILNGNTSEEPSGVFPEQKTQSVALQKIGFHPRQGRDRQKERRLQNQRLEQTGAGTRQSEHLGGKAPLGPRPQKRQVSHSFFIHRRINSYVKIFTYKVNSNWIISASQYRNMKKKLNVTINTFLPLMMQSNLDSALSVL